ncbi:hypothetical protein D1007_56309 [Hordeum vulgare]|nr:hypothetical protein D1007_56309 [Hordeum vulgare]
MDRPTCPRLFVPGCQRRARSAILLFLLLAALEILVDRAHGAAQRVVAGGVGAEAGGGRQDEALGSVAGLAEGVEAAVEVRERCRAPGLADNGGCGVDQRVVSGRHCVDGAVHGARPAVRGFWEPGRAGMAVTGVDRDRVVCVESSSLLHSLC